MTIFPSDHYRRLLSEVDTMNLESLPKTGLSDRDDQRKILLDMLTDGINLARISDAYSLFYNVDNIFFAYDEQRSRCSEVFVPDWYREKYGHLPHY